jgi:hypothetical protein
MFCGLILHVQPSFHGRKSKGTCFVSGGNDHSLKLISHMTWLLQPAQIGTIGRSHYTAYDSPLRRSDCDCKTPQSPLDCMGWRTSATEPNHCQTLSPFVSFPTLAHALTSSLDRFSVSSDKKQGLAYAHPSILYAHPCAPQTPLACIRDIQRPPFCYFTGS